MVFASGPLHAIPVGLLARIDEPNCAELVEAASTHGALLARLKKTRTTRPEEAHAIFAANWLNDDKIKNLRSQAERFGVDARFRGIGAHENRAVSLWIFTGPVKKLTELFTATPFAVTSFHVVGATELISKLDRLEANGNAFLEARVNGVTQRLSVLKVNGYFARRLTYLRTKEKLAVEFTDARSITKAIEDYAAGVVVAQIDREQFVIGYEDLIYDLRGVSADDLDHARIPRVVTLAP